MSQNNDDEFARFDARMRQLRPEVDDAAQEQARRQRSSGYRALHAGIEIVVGVAAGALIGYGLDAWLNTTPLFIVLLFTLGMGAGFLNAMRTLRRLSSGTAETLSGKDESR